MDGKGDGSCRTGSQDRRRGVRDNWRSGSAWLKRNRGFRACEGFAEKERGVETKQGELRILPMNEDCAIPFIVPLNRRLKEDKRK